MPLTQDKTKHTLWLYAGDFATLAEMYPDLGASIVVRTLIRKHIERIEKGIEKPKLPKIDMNI